MKSPLGMTRAKGDEIKIVISRVKWALGSLVTKALFLILIQYK
jgi:hypothetical protein